MNYLLDTNVIIGVLRGAGPYLDYLDRLVEETVPAISAATRSEVFVRSKPPPLSGLMWPFRERCRYR